MRKQVLMFLLATGASVGGIFTQPALAACTASIEVLGAVCDSTSSCTVNTGIADQPDPIGESPFPGTCTNGSSCTVNIGDCHDGGACTVNLGECSTGGACTVNTDIGNCSGGGTCTVNDGTCANGGNCTVASGDCRDGDDSTICLNTVCDGAVPASEGYTGRFCVMDMGGNEASGVVFNDPTKEFGDLTAALTVTVSDPTTNTVSNVTITCTMQSVPTHGAGGVSRSVTMSGNTAVMADTISFNRAPGTPSYLCTEFSWNSTKGHSVVIRDVDNDSSNGYQCAEYTYTN